MPVIRVSPYGGIGLLVYIKSELLSPELAGGLIMQNDRPERDQGTGAGGTQQTTASNPEQDGDQDRTLELAGSDFLLGC